MAGGLSNVGTFKQYYPQTYELMSNILTQILRMAYLRPRLVRFMLRYNTYLCSTYAGTKTALKSSLGPYLSKYLSILYVTTPRSLDNNFYFYYMGISFVVYLVKSGEINSNQIKYIRIFNDDALLL